MSSERRSVEKLAAQLRSREVAKRYHAAESLAAMGEEAKPAFAMLRRSLREEEHAVVRKSVALAIGELGIVDGREDLSEAAQRDEDPCVRQRAEEAFQSLSLKCKIVSI